MVRSNKLAIWSCSWSFYHVILVAIGWCAIMWTRCDAIHSCPNKVWVWWCEPKHCVDRQYKIISLLSDQVPSNNYYCHQSFNETYCTGGEWRYPAKKEVEAPNSSSTASATTSTNSTPSSLPKTRKPSSETGTCFYKTRKLPSETGTCLLPNLNPFLLFSFHDSFNFS